VDTRDGYLGAGEAALTLLQNEAVAAAWDQPSALELMSVGALAAHLSSQYTSVPGIVGAAPSAEQPLTLLDYYGQVTWRGAGLDNETNTAIRESGEAAAEAGPAQIAANAAAALEKTRGLLSGVPESQVIVVPWNGLPLVLGDFLTTRLLEIVVHCDDLAYSVGIASPQFPSTATDRVIGLLSQLAVQRHGVTNVLRALARAERAPAGIAAI
jgi:hypothetical protein